MKICLNLWNVRVVMNSYLRNPLTLWLKWLYVKVKLEHRFKEKHLEIGYMSLLLEFKPGRYNTIYENVSLRNVELGDFTYISRHSEIMNTIFGKFCSVGGHCKIGLGIHPTDMVSTHPSFFSKEQQAQISFTEKNEIVEYKKIVIGNDVWIGTAAIIVDGVSIGDGAIIAAGAVVTKDVPAYAVVGGVPAKVIRYRFTENKIAKLKASKWWDKDISWLRAHQKEMLDIDSFLLKLK